MENPVRSMTLTYVLSLTFVAILLLSIYLILDAIIVAEQASAKNINVSGEQRMLSQRASLLANDFFITGRDDSRTHALQSINRMIANHEFLLKDHKSAMLNNETSPLSTTLESMYFAQPINVQRRLEEFENAVFSILNASNQGYSGEGDSIEKFHQRRESLLIALDKVVKQYESEANERVLALRNYLSVSFSILVILLVLIALFVFRPMVSRIGDYAKKIERDANVDYLSGLLNRRAFYMLAKSAQSVSRRYNRPTSAILIDIDHFKNINDTFGHEIGDQAIKFLSSLINDFFRTSDIVARFGGEEFVVLLHETNLNEGVLVAERLRSNVSNSLFTSGKNKIPMTISCGVSSSAGSEENADQIIARADIALYEAKRSGRNRVVGRSLEDDKKKDYGAPVLSMN